MVGSPSGAEVRQVRDEHRQVVAASVWIAVASLVVPAFGQTACEHQKIVASDGEDDDQFGFAVALRGPTAAIGAFGTKRQGPFTGAVYVFDHDGAGWVETSRLVSPDASQGDYFGMSVAMSSALLAVGAPSAFPSVAPGKVHLFARQADGWVHMQRLNGSLAPQGARFGLSVGVQGTRVVVGSPEDLDPAATGRIYVFELESAHPDEGWTEVAVLQAADGAGSDRFGTSVAVSADRIIVGAPRHGGGNAGAAYVFRRTPDGLWTQEAKFSGVAGSLAGSAVAISGALAVVGAPGVAPGRADVYRLTDAGWTFEQTLTSGGQSFGWAVACAGNLVLVGGRSDPAYGGDNAARIFRRETHGWVHADGLHVAPPAVPDFFSRSIALNGNAVLVGANRDGIDNAFQPGAAYAFGLNGCSYCPADFDLSGSVDPLDVIAFLDAYADADPVADFDGDGSVNSLDVIAFLRAWAAGCA